MYGDARKFVGEACLYRSVVFPRLPVSASPSLYKAVCKNISHARRTYFYNIQLTDKERSPLVSNGWIYYGTHRCDAHVGEAGFID